MKLCLTERPSALPAALAQVVVPSARVAAPTAHVAVVGRPAVRIRMSNGVPQLQVLAQPAASGTIGGFAGKGIDLGKYGTNGASGVPPRGRPV